MIDIVEQSVPVAIIAVGMTLVLLTAGIDLSVGATMYAGVVAGSLLVGDGPVVAAIAVCVSVGCGIGLVHALLINRFGVAPFVVTLATMFIIRGIAKRSVQAKAIIAPSAVTDLERASVAGIPLAIVVMLFVVAAAMVMLNATPIGRQIYAIGENRQSAIKAGISIRQVTAFVYAACGGYAALGGFVALTQQGAAQNTFGTGVEFSAVAAAVLGGTSLFGGRGHAAGAVFGAVFISVVNASLNFANPDPYLYPLVTASLIFVSAALDAARSRIAARQSRRRIR